MDSTVYLLVALGLVALCWFSIKTIPTFRRVGFLRLAAAMSAFIVAVVGAIIGLVARRRSSVSTGAEEKVVLAAEEDHRDKSWDKVGAVSVPEQYVHHSDPEISGLAQANLDDD